VVDVVVVVVVVIVVKEKNINHLKGRDPEKCVLCVKRENVSYTISTLSDTHCKFCCHIYKNMYKKQNTSVKVDKNFATMFTVHRCN
jgi:hypothetical protein